MGFSSDWYGYGDYRAEKRAHKEEAREHDWWRATAICDVDGLFVLAASLTNWSIGENASLLAMLQDITANHDYDLDLFGGDMGFKATLLRD